MSVSLGASVLFEPEASLSAQIWMPVRHRWKMVLGGALLAAIAVLVVQAVQTPEYTARMVLSPTDQGSSNLNSQLGRLSGLASIAGVSLGDKTAVSEFEKFQYLVFSERLGEYQARHGDILKLVFRKRWDAAMRQWQRPRTLGQAFRNTVYPIFGLPAWQAPDGRDLADEYDRRLASRKLGETALLQLSYRDSDPVRAATVLSAIVHDANELLRQDAQRKALSQSAYLRRQLGLAQVQEYRENLAQLLARQEQTLMLAAAEVPYAAEALQPQTISKEPTSQRPFLYAGIAAVVGLSFSAFVAILMGLPSRWRARRASSLILPATGDDGPDHA